MHFALRRGKKRRGVRPLSVRGTALCWAGGAARAVPGTCERRQLSAAGRQRGAAWGVSWLVISASRNSQGTARNSQEQPGTAGNSPPGRAGGALEAKMESKSDQDGITRWDAVQMESSKPAVERSQRCSMAAAGSINRQSLFLPPKAPLNPPAMHAGTPWHAGTRNADAGAAQSVPRVCSTRATLPPTARQQANERRHADNKGKREKGSSRQMLRQGPIRHSAPRLLGPRGDKPLGLVSPERWRRPCAVPSTCGAADGAARRPGTGYARTRSARAAIRSVSCRRLVVQDLNLLPQSPSVAPARYRVH
ncbi:hypothetical protein M441DRAFT_261887 [Trichoderma asperellum CBS 433.97]|uniref:Uncharacterized protein n=1 Tax=Trichoderma asperellum (strain ATCC 204424 / CBS 433.97 / NBRC 101777) TaxID=1042311 RepID=A0A2T3YX24_TRIA4|nr:hypothetical protein M441DRAFT_261887 [Trichoderma asperellum CBS 433.97]PTB37096.1 hypothetical protein M441DRAFT_261887 [Trichoderma asperellum CBS 433.97]